MDNIKSFINRSIVFLTSFFTASSIASMTRLLTFITIVSANIGLLYLIIGVTNHILNGNTVDLYGVAAMIGAIATVLTVGFGGKYYGAKLENAKAKEELNFVPDIKIESVKPTDNIDTNIDSN